MIWPDALDLMSTGLMGSTVPVAWTRTAMSPRLAGVVGRGVGPEDFSLHATMAVARRNIERRRRCILIENGIRRLEGARRPGSHARRSKAAPPNGRRRHVHP